MNDNMHVLCLQPPRLMDGEENNSFMSLRGFPRVPHALGMGTNRRSRLVSPFVGGYGSEDKNESFLIKSHGYIYKYTYIYTCMHKYTDVLYKD